MNPKSLLITVILCFILALALARCVSSLPTATNEPSATAMTEEEAATTEPADDEPAADERAGD